MGTALPSSVVAERSFVTRAAVTLPFTTWYSSTAVSFARFLARLASVAFGTFAKAALVGAKTVSGPRADSALARPAFLTSETSVVNCGFAAAVWTIVMSFMPVVVAGAAVALPAGPA